MSERERDPLLDGLAEHYAPAPLDPVTATRLRARAEEPRTSGRLRLRTTFATGCALTVAALALLLLRAPVPAPADPDPATVAWADELLFPEEMVASPRDDESAMLPDEYQALDELFLSGT